MSNINSITVTNGKQFGRLFKLLRIESGMTLHEAAIHSSISYSRLSRLENDRPNIRLGLDELCRLLAGYERVVEVREILDD